jgi:cell division protein FtsL
MINWTVYTVKQEQHVDRLREAEKRRLIQQVTANGEPSRIGQMARNLVLRIARQQPDRAQLAYQARTRPAQKA